MKPIVAIIGRPNAGKSTLFNRITRSRNALVDDFPGVTRDRIYGNACWDNMEFTLVDTGGFGDDDSDGFAGQVRFQVQQAIQDADIILLVLDGKGGISPYDQDLVKILRGLAKPVFYTVNKIDGEEQSDRLYDFYALGIDSLYPISAEHGYGIHDLMDDLIQALPQAMETEAPDVVKLAVVGRPNVGKSSLINRIMGQQRLLVSDVPGTTRDAIDSLCEINGRSYLLVDTAGIRRRKKVSKKLEKFSIIKALKSMDRCHIALIMIDAVQGVADQDVHIAGYAYERGCGCVLLINKWDAIEKDSHTAKRFIEDLRLKAKFLNFAPVLTISALTGQRVARIFAVADEVYAQYTFRIGTGKLNKIIERAIASNEPSLVRGRRIKFYYGTQVSTRPPSFVLFVNYPEAVHFSYRRYLINQIRMETSLDKTPLRLTFRKRSGKRGGARKTKP
ncbi:MAG: ribosome biogenesis GTPase Der [Desulfobacterales bacterium]|nr:ribosome biogenesis GTPase Der [Desulfobacterales bacterium]